MTKFDSRERARSPDDRIVSPNNGLRIDLYRHLLPQLQNEDQNSGAQGFTAHWDDPGAVWDSGDLNDVWDAVGLAPIYQTLFYVLESLEGDDIEILESLDTIIDPFETPVELLDDLAASFGYRLEDSLSEEAKRIVVQGLFNAYKALGQSIGFKVFYRMIGFNIITVFPLFKKDVEEANNDYNRTQFATTSVSEAVGPAGNLAYQTTLSQIPIQPGTLRITDGTTVLKDQPAGFPSDGLTDTNGIPLATACACRGTIIGPTGAESGTINYGTGELEVNFGAATVGAVTASWERIDEEWPYHAARLDIEILLNPAGLPIPLVDAEVIGNLLDRLDEVRPIHVLLRAVTLAFEIQDTVDPTATDQTACTQILRDTRDAFGGSPGRDFLHLIDDGPSSRGDELGIFVTGGAITDRHDQVLEDLAEGICPGLDVLDIDAGAFSQVV